MYVNGYHLQVDLTLTADVCSCVFNYTPPLVPLIHIHTYSYIHPFALLVSPQNSCGFPIFSVILLVLFTIRDNRIRYYIVQHTYVCICMCMGHVSRHDYEYVMNEKNVLTLFLRFVSLFAYTKRKLLYLSHINDSRTYVRFINVLSKIVIDKCCY